VPRETHLFVAGLVLHRIYYVIISHHAGGQWNIYEMARRIIILDSPVLGTDANYAQKVSTRKMEYE
jgi:hypothetical protein